MINRNLTPREWTILELLIDGQSNQYIAHQLKISKPTVNNALTSISRKFGTQNRVQIAVYAIRNDLIPKQPLNKEKQ